MVPVFVTCITSSRQLQLTSLIPCVCISSRINGHGHNSVKLHAITLFHRTCENKVSYQRSMEKQKVSEMFRFVFLQAFFWKILNGVILKVF